VDARSDIFSFGLVLYEMITGKRAFEGSNPTSIIAAILEREAPALEPEGLNRVVRACLAKDPADRFQTARDLKRAIEWSVSGDGETPLPEGAPEPGRARRQWLGWSVAAVATAGLATALWAPWRAEKPVDRPLARLDVDLGADVSLPIPSNRASNVAISPDGMRLAYASGTPVKLFTRRLDQSKATELPGTEGAIGPFFSPDGQWVGFVSGSSLSKISVDGGTAVALGHGRASITHFFPDRRRPVLVMERLRNHRYSPSKRRRRASNSPGSPESRIDRQ
jgi:serine/threonine protein kinase